MTGHTPAQKERLVLIMKKTYKIEVDCANCAQKMEDAANTVAGVEKATVSFMTQKMKVEFAEGADPHATMENVLSACKKVEDDCEIFDIGPLPVRSPASLPGGSSPLWESFSFLCRRAAENSSFSWKKRAVFNTFHALFNTLRGKLQKETWKSKFSAGKSRGKHGGKGGKSIFVGKTC